MLDGWSTPDLAHHVVLGYWLVCLVALGLSLVVPALGDMSRYGKIRASKPGKRGSAIVDWVVGLVVPKRWFSHFYIVGAAVNGALLVHLILVWQFNEIFFVHSALKGDTVLGLFQFMPSGAEGSMVLVGCSLVEIHLIRRWMEQWFLFRPSLHAKMHLLGYLLGVSFYIFMPLSIVLSAPQSDNAGRVWVFDHWHTVWHPGSLVGLVLFTVGFLAQHAAHRTLAGLRKSSADSYSRPHGVMFETVSCPHYAAECVLYCGVAVMVPGWATVLVVVFSAANLGLTATRTWEWYRKMYHGYPVRWAMVPGVW
mmetsp:Transcript_116088/g.266431  ORF Transcript_116088/g.266431 Transcript_116088/m.266431 type:complete len:309 (+) Transcript_116088:18-944(+)